MKKKILTLFSIMLAGIILLLAGLIFLPTKVPGIYRSKLEKRLPNTFVAIAYGDPRIKFKFCPTRHSYICRTVADRIAWEKPDFIINTGDLVNLGTKRRDWEAFDRQNASILAKKIPYFPCLGNHEYGGKKPFNFNHYFKRFPDLHRNKWYAFTCRNIKFVVLDSNYEDLKKGEIENQEKWLITQMNQITANREIDLGIVIAHHAPYSNGLKHQGSQKMCERIIPLIRKCSKVRLFISGHTHSYEHFFIKGIHYLVTAGGGAHLHKVKIRQKKQPQDLFQGPTLRNYHYCRLTFHPNHLDVSMIMLTGGKWIEKDRFHIIWRNTFCKIIANYTNP